MAKKHPGDGKKRNITPKDMTSMIQGEDGLPGGASEEKGTHMKKHHKGHKGGHHAHGTHGHHNKTHEEGKHHTEHHAPGPHKMPPHGGVSNISPKDMTSYVHSDPGLDAHAHESHHETNADHGMHHGFSPRGGYSHGGEEHGGEGMEGNAEYC